MNYFELYPGDYLRDTGELSLIQHGAFLLLMASCYSTEKGLPSEPMGLFRITSALTPEEQEATLFVARRFFKLCEDGRLHNERIDDDIKKAKVRIEAAKANGAKGGRPPKAKQNPTETGRKPTGFPPGSDPVEQNETQSKAHQTPPTITTSERDARDATSVAGAAGIAFRKAGCVGVNLSNPDFLAALGEGVTAEEFGNAADQAKDRGIDPHGRFAYAVKVARTNHAKTAAVVSLPSARAGPGAPAPSKTLQAIQSARDQADELIRHSTASLGREGADYRSIEAPDPRSGRASGG